MLKFRVPDTVLTPSGRRDFSLEASRLFELLEQLWPGRIIRDLPRMSCPTCTQGHVLLGCRSFGDHVYQRSVLGSQHLLDMNHGHEHFEALTPEGELVLQMNLPNNAEILED